MGAYLGRASGDVSAVRLPATPVRGGDAIVMACQAFETPEGDHAGPATFLADEALVTEHEASALVHMRRRRLLALRTDQREMSCTPTLSEMSKPVHVFLLHGARSLAVQTHQIISALHVKVEKNEAGTIAANVPGPPISHEKFHQRRPGRLRGRIGSRGMEPRFRLNSIFLPWFSCREQSSWP